MNFRSLPLFLLLVFPGASFGAPSEADIVGAWACGPYEMRGPDFVVSAIDRPIYSNDGKFTELGTATYTLSDDTKIRTETKHVGSWSLQGDIIEIRFTSSELLSSDHPAFPIAVGQASLDAMMQRKSWSRKRVVAFGGKLVTVPVDAIYEQAEVEVSCSEA